MEIWTRPFYIIVPPPAGQRWCRKAPKGEKPPQAADSAKCCPYHMRIKLSMQSTCVPFRWQRNWICRGAKRPENPVTCFPAGRRGPRSGAGVYDAASRIDTLCCPDCQSAAFPPICIYYRLSHKRHLPRFFASLRMTSGREGNPVTQAPSPGGNPA